MTDHSQPKKTLARKRRANVLGGRKHRHVVYVSPEEEAVLIRMAAGERVTVPRLLVEAAMSAGAETPTQRRELITRLFAVSRVLAGSANNLNQIARVANTEGRLAEDLAATLVELRERMVAVDEALEELAFS